LAWRCWPVASSRPCSRWPSPAHWPGPRLHARTRATLDTSGPTFAVFLLGVIIIVGGLICFPMLILGPIGERFVG